MKIKWICLEDELPCHKDMVLVSDGISVIPAIYYDNFDFTGFYKFTTFYKSSAHNVYLKVYTKEKHKIYGTLHWAKFPDCPK